MRSINALSDMFVNLHAQLNRVTLVDKRDHGTHIKLRRGNRLIVELDSHPGSGFQWIPTQSSLKHVDDIVIDYKPVQYLLQPADTEITRLSFLISKKGNGQLVLNYVKSWQPDNIERVFSLEYEVVD